MKTFIEIAKERGAKLMDIFDVANPQNTTGILVNEKILKATFDDYCKQLSEPIGEVHELSNGWDCYIWQKAIDDGLIKDGDFVYAQPAQIPSEVKAHIESMRAGTTIINLFKSPEKTSEVKDYIERLEYGLLQASRHLDLLQPSSTICKIVSDAIASKPDCLKD